jgi:hypothetical protein
MLQNQCKTFTEILTSAEAGPEKEDTVLLRTGTERKARHCMLMEVKEAYSLYYQKHPDNKIGHFYFTA